MSLRPVRPLKEIEKEEIHNAVLVKRNVVKAAKALGIPTTTMYRKLHEYGLSYLCDGFRDDQPTFPKWQTG